MLYFKFIADVQKSKKWYRATLTYKNAYILIFKESTIDIMVDLMLHDLMGGQVRKCLVKIQIANC